MENKETFGQFLKNKRIEAGVSIEEIAAQTKINTRILQNLENDELSELPSPTFVRGFIRSYSKHLLLDPKNALMLYDLFLYGEANTSEIDKYIDKDLVKINQVNRNLLWWGMAFVFVLLILGLLIFFISKSNDEKKLKESISLKKQPLNSQNTESIISPETVSAVPVAEVAKTEESTNITELTKIDEPVKEIVKNDLEPKTLTNPETINTEPVNLIREPEKEQKVIITATKLVWVKAQLDDGSVFDFMLPEGKTRILKAKSQIKTLFGDASSVRVIYKDKEIAVLGEEKSIRSVVFPGLGRWR